MDKTGKDYANLENRDLQPALITLIRESRNWATVKRGLELFEHVKDMLRGHYHVDSGYFVFKKAVSLGEGERSFRVYSPWGDLHGTADELQQDVDRTFHLNANLADSASEQWLTRESVPGAVKAQWRDRGIQTGGSWIIKIGEVPAGMMVLYRRNLKTDDSLVMSLVVEQLSLVMELLRYRRAAEEASQRDPLTGIYNRRGATVRIRTLAELRSAAADNWIFAIFDVDHFKAINDQHGHPQGDRVLKEVAQVLSANLREGDICGRWGGDEFVIMLQCPKDLAPHIVSRLKDTVSCQVDKVSVSVGWAIWGQDGTTLKEIYRAADRRLYHDKVRNT